MHYVHGHMLALLRLFNESLSSSSPVYVKSLGEP